LNTFKEAADLSFSSKDGALDKAGLAATATTEGSVKVLDKGAEVCILGADGVGVALLLLGEYGADPCGGLQNSVTQTAGRIRGQPFLEEDGEACPFRAWALRTKS